MENPIVEIEKFFVQDNCCYRSGKIWEASTLFNASKGLKPYDLQLAALDLTNAFPSANNIAEFVFQVKRMQQVDLSYPIIQAPDGWIMDGYHRIAKAILEGKTTIKAVRLPALPEPDREEKE